mgnify:FL=1
MKSVRAMKKKEEAMRKMKRKKELVSLSVLAADGRWC